MSESLWLAFALMLVLEGLLPFIAPKAWRSTFENLLTLHDGQIRFLGLGSILLGLILMMII